MNLRQRLDNLPVGQKLLAALLILLATVLLVANLAFISAAYWISQESVAPQAMQTIGRLIANPALSQPALSSPQTAEVLLRQLNDYQPLRAAALYDSNGLMLADLQRGDTLKLPARLDRLEHWRRGEYRLNALIELPRKTPAPATCCWWPAVNCRARSTPGPSPPAWRSSASACCSGCWWRSRYAA